MTVLTVFGDQGWNKYGDIAKNFVLTDSSGSVPALRRRRRGAARPDARGQCPGVQSRRRAREDRLSDGRNDRVSGRRRAREGWPECRERQEVHRLGAVKKTQELLVKEAGRRSVRTDVSGPGDLPPLSSLKLVELKSIDELGGTAGDPRQVAQGSRPIGDPFRTRAVARAASCVRIAA